MSEKNGTPGIGYPLQLQMPQTLSKIYEITVFRQWTTGSTGQRSLRDGGKPGEPKNCHRFPEAQGRETQAKAVNLGTADAKMGVRGGPRGECSQGKSVGEERAAQTLFWRSAEGPSLRVSN